MRAGGRRSLRVVLAALLVAALPAAGCAGGGRREPPARHLLVVTIDTIRADRLGCYGRKDAGTPRLDALARGGVRFRRAYAQAPITLPSHVSLFTGLYPARTGVRVNGQKAVNPGVRSIAEILGAEGFLTAAAVGGYPVSGRFPVRAGFDRFDDRMADPRNPAGLERDAGEVVAAALRLLPPGVADRRVFLWVHLFDPHDPYDPPAPFREAFANDPYQGEIARVDTAVGELLDAVAPTLGNDGLLVCIVGDHGESLGEHGEDTHGLFLYEPTMRVPLILAGPRVPAGATLPGPVQTVDLFPTLLDLLGLAVPQGLDGAVLDLAGAGPAERRIFIESRLPYRNYGWSPLHGVIAGQRKYVSAPRPELYDLASDPAESTNLAAEHPEEVEEMERWVRGQLQRAGGAAQAEDAPDARLMSLGYVGAGGTGTAGNAGPAGTAGLPDPKDRIDTYRRFQAAGRALEAGRPADALPLLDALLAEADTPGVRFRRAAALRMSGRLDEARGELARVERAAPDQPGLHLERTRIAVATGDFAAALAAAERHLAVEPDDAEALMFRGAAREKLGDAGGAEDDYRKALVVNPAFAGASLRLAALLVRDGRTNEARAVLSERLARDPSDELARGLLGSL